MIASVIVPAHDEADTIERTLRTLLADADPGEFEVVVVCNGCRDDTAAKARRVPGIDVVEIATPSKIAALNAGDRRARVFPRIYLDADTTLSTAAARALVEALTGPGVRIAGMRADLDLAGATRPARWFHEFRSSLPVFAHGIIGSGVYALDGVARRRFADWPDVQGDDQYILRSFAPVERAFVRDHRTRTSVAGDLGRIVRRGVRVRRGNRQLSVEHALAAPSSGLGQALRAAVSRPSSWAGATTYLVVSLAIRFRSWRGGSGDWPGPAPKGPRSGGDR